MLKIEKEKAKKLYPESPQWFREELEKAFGKKSFLPKDFTSIKTFEDACQALELDPSGILYENDTPDETAYKKLKIIIRAINQGWVPDWENTNQEKWWPWFNLSSGFGFSLSYFGYDFSSTIVGSRLCFETKKKSDYTANQFIDLYRNFLTLND
jgi:hypothetical protein